MRAAAPANPAPLQNEKSNNHKDGDEQFNSNGEAEDRQVCAQDREKRSTIFRDDECDGGGGAAGGEPVAPADDESRIITERAAREIVLAAAAGNRGAKLRHGGCSGKGVEAAEDPNSEKHPRIGQELGDVAGRSSDPGRDSISDRRGDAKPHTENLE